jgi:hypothetical protein
MSGEHDDRGACALCGTHEPEPGLSTCAGCLEVIGQQRRRRQDAAGRLPPLPDGRRDPLYTGPIRDGRAS